MPRDVYVNPLEKHTQTLQNAQIDTNYALRSGRPLEPLEAIPENGQAQQSLEIPNSEVVHLNNRQFSKS